MSRESMKDIIENSIKSAGLSETEVAEWVSNLKAFHDEEVRRQALRLDEFDEDHRQHSQAVDNFEATVQQLDKTLGTLRQESATLAKERDELARLKAQLERTAHDLSEGVVRGNREPLTWRRLVFLFGVIVLSSATGATIFVVFIWLFRRGLVSL